MKVVRSPAHILRNISISPVRHMRIFVLTFPAFSATRPGVPSELLNCAQVKSDQSSGAAARVCEPVGQSHLGGDCTRNWAPTINSIGPKKWFGITFEDV